MKKVVFLILICMVVLSTVSAEIIFDKQPEGVYNLEDSVDILVTVKALESISGNFKMNLICESKQIVYFQNGVSLNAGEEKKMETSLILNKENLGATLGDCKIKASLGEEYEITNDFEISNLITIETELEETEFKPEEEIVIKGNAIKENGEDVDGFISLKIVSGNNSSVEKLSTISNGFFSVSLTIPENMESGNHVVQLNAYELNSDEEQTNKGFMSFNINIEQVPTNLEIVIEEEEILPGNILKTKAILHDQTGKEISAPVIITIKKSKNEIVQQIETNTGELIEVNIPYNELPKNWTIVAVSSMLDSERSFTVLENKEVSIDVVNGTVILTNVGNVPYNESILIKIGENSSLNIDVFLEVDEVKKYELRAPDGEYYVEIISEGESHFWGGILLTGRAVDFKELGVSGRGIIKVLVWIFIIGVLGFVAFVIYKKGYKKSFFGSKKKLKNSEMIFKKESPKKHSELINTSNKAILSLSINGDRHDASIVCLKIKNLKDLKKEGINETFKRIVSFAEGKKTMIYEANENIFFIFSALKTRTFKNEKSAIELAGKIEEFLKYHNKIFKQKFDFGISINFGEIVGKINEKDELEFMAMGNLIVNSKKLSELSSGEVLLSKDFRDRAGGMLKTGEKEIAGKKVYIIRELRDREQHKKFLANFLHNLEKDKAEREKREKKD